MNPLRKTKIICTIGPSSNTVEMLRSMYKAGMNAVRLNMSHGDHENHRKVIRSVKAINQKIKDSIPVLMDLEGPEIRTGKLENDVLLKDGSVITVSLGEKLTEGAAFNIVYTGLKEIIKEGDRVKVDNGLINLEVLRIDDLTLECRVIDGGIMGSLRHVNFPGIHLNMPSISEHDRNHVLFGMEEGVDFIAVSFVRDAQNVLELKELLGDKANKIKIISKIEDRWGVENLDEIIDASDALMVARGDLGIEIELEELPNIQRTIVHKCHEKGKRVIVATHLLESMTENPIPTRAEVIDVANAIYSEVDALMLSGETAVGKYPIRCVEHIDRIAKASEKLPGIHFSREVIINNDKQNIALSGVKLAESIEAKGIVVITRRGIMAQFLTNCRPFKTYIYAFTNDNRTRRQLFINRGVVAHRIEFSRDPEKTIQNAFNSLKKHEGFEPGDRVVVISDILAGSGIDAIQIRAIS